MDADRRGNVLIPFEFGGSNDNAEVRRVACCDTPTGMHWQVRRLRKG